MVDEYDYKQCIMERCQNYAHDTEDPFTECSSCNGTICELCYANSLGCQLCTHIMCDNEKCNVVGKHTSGVCRRCERIVDYVLRNCDKIVDMALYY